MIEVPNMCGWVASWEAERDKLDDPYRIHMVDTVIKHSLIEAERDWDGVMPTLHEEAVYQSASFRPDRNSSKQEMRKNYEDLDRRNPGYIGRMEQEMEHFLVGPDAVAHDGDCYQICKGSELESRDLELPEGDSPDDDYLIAWRMALFIPFKDGLMMGEDTYSGETRIVKKLSSEMTRTRRALGRIWAEV